MSRRLLYVANVAWFFRSHRLPVALEALKQGFEVHLASAFEDHGERLGFEKYGIRTHEVPFDRSGMGLLAESRTILGLRRLLIRLRPMLCHNISIKPVIYGGVISRMLGVPAVNAISGLGYSYIAEGRRAGLRRRILNWGYLTAVGGEYSRVVVQNEDDLVFFRSELGLAEEKLVLIRGSGVDLGHFDPDLPLANPPLVVLPARMLADKGVREFVAAAKAVRRQGITARFALVGGLDPHNRSALTQEDMDHLAEDGEVEYWGHRTDIPQILSAAQVVCLPSYREGLPKALLEAAAAGRAIVTTDVPGCREVVRHGENGLLVPPRDSQTLAAALAKLISNPDLCMRMGRRGRLIAENDFSIDITVRKTIALYREMLE